jgi:uncharacterized radical SAM protein YgiQ
MSRREMEWRGWEQLDVIIVTGDAFIDHPSFEVAVVGRVLETFNLRVGFIAQPAWNNERDITQLGRPRLFFAINSGKNDSMVANYRPTKRPRKIDFFSPGRLPGLRPDRSCQTYTELCKRVYPQTPVVLFGLEATMRRFAHYDFWDDNLRPGLLAQCAADLLVYSHPERAMSLIAKTLARGGDLAECRAIRGVVYAVSRQRENVAAVLPAEPALLPSWENLQTAKSAFVEAFRVDAANADYYRRPRPVVQDCGALVLVQTPPQRPLSTGEMDRIYALPYSRTPHPKYREAGPIPSFETVKYAITTHRGCFGDCAFCGQHVYEHRHLSQRSRQSILQEAAQISGLRYFRGWISNVGGPMANMYGMGCTAGEEELAACTRPSCLEPARCPRLNTDHREYLDVLRAVRGVDGVERCYLSSQLRIDIMETDALADEMLEEIMRNYLPGHLKIPFEHVSGSVSRYLHKYDRGVIESFIQRFQALAQKLQLPEMTITPFFISGHPGSRMEDAIEVAQFVRKYNFLDCQIQDFVPMPGTASACMQFTGIDPYSDETVYRPLAYRERKLQRSLFHFYKPQNERYVYDALREIDRLDLVGDGPDCLLRTEPAWSPFE